MVVRHLILKYKIKCKDKSRKFLTKATIIVMFINVDGSTLEGGGQLLRMCIVLSALSGQPFKIYNIRANRKKNGLAPQHLTGLQLARDLCQGSVENAFLGSTGITFAPHAVKSGSFVADTQTGGSVALIFQVAHPLTLFSNNICKLTLKGGTNADFAPPIDYTINVFKPMIQKFGIDFDCEIIRRGFYQGNGQITVKTFPVKNLLPIDLVLFGEVESITGEAYVSGVMPFKVAEEMARAAEYLLKNSSCTRISIKSRKFHNSEAFGNGFGINLFAKTSTGCFLGSSALGKRGVKASEVGSDAANHLLDSLNKKCCADSNMQDQLIVYMALAKGRSRVKVGTITLHTQTAIHVAENFTKAKFNIFKFDENTNLIECDGIGLENEYFKEH